MNLGGIFHERGSSQTVNSSVAARVTHWHPKRQNHKASPCSSWTMPIYSLPACLEQECKYCPGFMWSSNLPVYPGEMLLLAGKVACSESSQRQKCKWSCLCRVNCFALPTSQHPWAEQRLTAVTKSAFGVCPRLLQGASQCLTGTDYFQTMENATLKTTRWFSCCSSSKK